MSGRVLLLLWLLTLSVAKADGIPDLTPVRCAWSHLSPAQQERLREDFTVDNSGTAIVLQFASPSTEETASAAGACNLSYDARQLAALASALGARAGEDIGRRGVASRGGIKSDAIDRAIDRMHEGKRRIIGDALSCGGMSIASEWDQSLSGAMRRAQIRTVDGRTVALIAIAMFATFMQEGYLRRIAGTAEACENFR